MANFGTTSNDQAQFSKTMQRNFMNHTVGQVDRNQADDSQFMSQPQMELTRDQSYDPTSRNGTEIFKSISNSNISMLGRTQKVGK